MLTGFIVLDARGRPKRRPRSACSDRPGSFYLTQGAAKRAANKEGDSVHEVTVQSTALFIRSKKL